MKVLKMSIDIWPGRDNGVLVEKTSQDGTKYQDMLHKEEYELECMLMAIESEGITDLDQVDQLRKLIENYGSLKYSLGYGEGESQSNY